MTGRFTILVAEDDAGDRMLLKDAWQESGFQNDLRFVADGEELMDYLQRCGKYADAESSPLPDLILLDLDMPKKEGREALQEIQASAMLRSIPVIVLTSAKSAGDIVRSYHLGANSYVVKPATFHQLVCAVKTIWLYWFDVVTLPSSGGKAQHAWGSNP